MRVPVSGTENPAHTAWWVSPKECLFFTTSIGLWIDIVIFYHVKACQDMKKFFISLWSNKTTDHSLISWNSLKNVLHFSSFCVNTFANCLTEQWHCLQLILQPSSSFTLFPSEFIDQKPSHKHYLHKFSLEPAHIWFHVIISFKKNTVKASNKLCLLFRVHSYSAKFSWINEYYYIPITSFV